MTMQELTKLCDEHAALIRSTSEVQRALALLNDGGKCSILIAPAEGSRPLAVGTKPEVARQVLNSVLGDLAGQIAAVEQQLNVTPSSTGGPSGTESSNG